MMIKKLFIITSIRKIAAVDVDIIIMCFLLHKKRLSFTTMYNAIIIIIK